MVEQSIKMNQKYLDSLLRQQMLCAKLLNQKADQTIIEKTNELVIIAQE